MAKPLSPKKRKVMLLLSGHRQIDVQDELARRGYKFGGSYVCKLINNKQPGPLARDVLTPLVDSIIKGWMIESAAEGNSEAEIGTYPHGQAERTYVI